MRVAQIAFVNKREGTQGLKGGKKETKRKFEFVLLGNRLEQRDHRHRSLRCC